MKTIYAPFGRMNEQVAKLTEEQKQRAAIKPGTQIGQDDCLKIFPSRQFLARMIRKEEKHSPYSRWRPLVKLTDGEGY